MDLSNVVDLTRERYQNKRTKPAVDAGFAMAGVSSLPNKGRGGFTRDGLVVVMASLMKFRLQVS